MKKNLFISHSAGRTGAPLMLLNFLTWMKEKTDIQFEVLLKTTGELERDFARLAPTRIFSPSQAKQSIWARLKRRLGFESTASKTHIAHLLDHYRNSGISLIYSNTITNGEILEALSPIGIQAVTHIHELDYWIKESGEKNLAQVKRYSSAFITASHAVERNLVDNYGFSGDTIQTVHSFIPSVPVPPSDFARALIRKNLGISSDAFVVVGSGYETWRKGKDLFVQLAACVRQRLKVENVHFLWVGGRIDNEEYYKIAHDIKKAGLKEYVHFCGEVSNPLDYFAASDIFTLVSREDPYPLVCLEAAILGKPILCFDNAGGMPEFVEDDAGFVVPYLDVEAMADKVIDLIKDEKLREQTGERAAQKVKERHVIPVAAPQLLQAINQCF